MGETLSVDFRPVLKAIDVVNKNLNIINSNVNAVQQNVDKVDKDVAILRQETRNEIERIKLALIEMEKQARYRSAFQRAVTEVIRVRQEIEQKFGKHKVVRDYMLGILQAADLSLISKSTISNCTEELMISCPEYWLAPSLIALAAWISDNRTLAERAIKEAIKRDEEKTCLLFALITRRVNAGRIASGKPGSNVCFQWLNRYFALQDPRRMRSSIVAYVDAYSNGVFGNDAEHICEEHINHWMEILMKENPKFAEEQEAYWSNFFNSKVVGLKDDIFAPLEKLSPQFPQIEAYVSKIAASEKTGGIKEFIHGIDNGIADKEKLIKDIDRQLNLLVTNYEEGEEDSLRKEEELLQKIKETQGDEDAAKRFIAAKYAARADHPVDFAKRLSFSITSNDATISEKKTALALLKGYISNAYNKFIVESKGAYPSEIDLKFVDNGDKLGTSFTWTGKTENGENKAALLASIDTLYDTQKRETLAKVTDDEAQKTLKNAKICFFLFFLIIPIFIGMNLNKKGKAMLAANEAARERITKYYDNGKAEARKLLTGALDARARANGLVTQFLSNPSNEKIHLKGDPEEVEPAPAAEEAPAEAPAEEAAPEAAPEEAPVYDGRE